MSQDSDYKERFNQLNLEVHAITQNNSQFNDKSGLTTLPVVVHVIHVGEPVGTGSNISDLQIQRAIDKANEDFRNTAGGVDMEIEFCLASIDPNSQPTTGINRVDGSSVAKYLSEGISGIGCGTYGAIENDIKALSNWSADDYYNIWVVKSICNGKSGYAGYANYPSSSGTFDGTVLKYTYMDSPYMALSHELAHGLFLMHTFEGCCNGSNYKCPDNDDCSKQGDWVCDTPPHKKNDCAATNPCTTQGDWDKSRYNIMSYCSYLNRDRFTEGQKERMKATLKVNPRFLLTWSQKCSISSGIEQEKTNLTISVSNNPGPGNYMIKVKDEYSNYQVSVYNSVGKLISTFKQNKSEFDIHITNPSGIYILEVTAENGKRNQIKLIKW